MTKLAETFDTNPRPTSANSILLRQCARGARQTLTHDRLGILRLRPDILFASYTFCRKVLCPRLLALWTFVILPPCHLSPAAIMTELLTPERQSTEDASTMEKLTGTGLRDLQKLKALTCVREDIDGATIDINSLRRNCPLDQSSASSRIIRSNDTPATQSLSQLDRLPLETMQQIVEDFDLQTLTDFRAVNQRAMSVIDSIPRYREILTHVPDILRALLSTKLARHFDLSHLCSELHSDECFLCGSFGAFLFLPDCRRCCWLCLCEAEDTLPISGAQAKDSFELTNDALLGMPTMLTLPGTYVVGYDILGSGGARNMDGTTTYRRRMWLVSMCAARLAAFELHGLQRMRDSYMMEPRSFWTTAYARQGRRHRSSDHGQRIAKPPYPPYIRGPNFIGNEPRRFTTAIRFPTLDVTTGDIEWGVSCAGCRRHYPKEFQLNDAEYREHNRMYTKAGFLRHMKVCKWARRMWKEVSRPTYIKVLKDHIDPETLESYALPWEWDKAST